LLGGLELARQRLLLLPPAREALLGRAKLGEEGGLAGRSLARRRRRGLIHLGGLADPLLVRFPQAFGGLALQRLHLRGPTLGLRAEPLLLGAQARLVGRGARSRDRCLAGRGSAALLAGGLLAVAPE